MEELEPRLLFSADSPVVAIDPRAVDADVPPPVPAITETAETSSIAEIAIDDKSRESIQQRHEVVFVDASAPNYRQLIDDLAKSNDAGRKVEIVVIDSDRDGIEQITDALSRYRNLDAVHLVSHGEDGRLQIGSGQLTQDNVRRYAHVIQGWGQALKPDADLMLYGCDLAGSARGQSLIGDLATLTGADVAASTDLTGSTLLGGDWDLEYEVGDIETRVAFSDQAQEDWQGVLATVRDNFTIAGDYSGNDGSNSWTTPWMEIDADGGPTLGNIRVYDEPDDSGVGAGIDPGLRIGENTPHLAQNELRRGADLSGATIATLELDFRRDGDFGYTPAGADIFLEIRKNGSITWDPLDNWGFGLSEPTSTHKSYDISAWIAADTEIRFTQNNLSAGGFIHFDNIEITFDAPSGDTLAPVVVVNAGSTVPEGGTDLIDKLELRYDDDKQPPGAVQYTVTTVPVNGQLEHTGALGTPILSFTQADIDAGVIVYVHDGSETLSDSFIFSVDDGQGNATTGQKFDITVIPDNELVVTTDKDDADAIDGNTNSIAELMETPGTDGLISLREAIEATNNTANIGVPDRIIFDIAGAGLHTISLENELPDIIDAVEIDATTQKGFGVEPIRITSSSATGSGSMTTATPRPPTSSASG
jgi:hypothetical protein